MKNNRSVITLLVLCVVIGGLMVGLSLSGSIGLNNVSLPIRLAILVVLIVMGIFLYLSIRKDINKDTKHPTDKTK